MDSDEAVYFDEFINSEEARVPGVQRKKESYNLYKEVKPNIGHTSISDFEKRGKLLGLITQNIDGLHSRAACRTRRSWSCTAPTGRWCA